MNAIALLGEEHRQIQAELAEFQATSSPWREEQLAFEICAHIRVHMELGTTVFYPAWMTATEDRASAQRALNDHQTINTLIDEIERAGPTEESFFAKLIVLGGLFKRHVEQEEEAWGVFEAARESGLDLDAVGGALAARKLQLLRRVGELENSPHA